MKTNYGEVWQDYINATEEFCVYPQADKTGLWGYLTLALLSEYYELRGVVHHFALVSGDEQKSLDEVSAVFQEAVNELGDCLFFLARWEKHLRDIGVSVSFFSRLSGAEEQPPITGVELSERIARITDIASKSVAMFGGGVSQAVEEHCFAFLWEIFRSFSELVLEQWLTMLLSARVSKGKFGHILQTDFVENPRVLFTFSAAMKNNLEKLTRRKADQVLIDINKNKRGAEETK